MLYKIRIDHVCGSYLALHLLRDGAVESGECLILNDKSLATLKRETSQAFINKYLIEETP